MRAAQGRLHARMSVGFGPEARTGLGYWDARNRLLQRERPLVRGPKVVSRGVGVGFGDQLGAPMWPKADSHTRRFPERRHPYLDREYKRGSKLINVRTFLTSG